MRGLEPLTEVAQLFGTPSQPSLSDDPARDIAFNRGLGFRDAVVGVQVNLFVLERLPINRSIWSRRIVARQLVQSTPRRV